MKYVRLAEDGLEFDYYAHLGIKIIIQGTLESPLPKQKDRHIRIVHIVEPLERWELYRLNLSLDDRDVTHEVFDSLSNSINNSKIRYLKKEVFRVLKCLYNTGNRVILEKVLMKAFSYNRWGAVSKSEARSRTGRLVTYLQSGCRSAPYWVACKHWVAMFLALAIDEEQSGICVTPYLYYKDRVVNVSYSGGDFGGIEFMNNETLARLPRMLMDACINVIGASETMTLMQAKELSSSIRQQQREALRIVSPEQTKRVFQELAELEKPLSGKTILL